MNDQPTDLKKVLETLMARRRRVGLWSALAACWAAAAFLGLTIGFIERRSGWASSLSGPLIVLLAIVAALVLAFRRKSRDTDLRDLAREIERRHPELEGRLLTAVQQP